LRMTFGMNNTDVESSYWVQHLSFSLPVGFIFWTIKIHFKHLHKQPLVVTSTSIQFVVIPVYNEIINNLNTSALYRCLINRNKKSWEVHIAYDADHIENDVTNNFSIVTCVFVSAVTFLPNRCLATTG
jgi:hypothetical protein